MFNVWFPKDSILKPNQVYLICVAVWKHFCFALVIGNLNSPLPALILCPCKYSAFIVEECFTPSVCNITLVKGREEWLKLRSGVLTKYNTNHLIILVSIIKELQY